VILSTTNGVPGRRTLRILGIAKGNSIRARHAGRAFLAWLRGIVGGEITDYTKVIAEAREQALDRLVEDARRLGADAVVGLRFTSTEVMRNAAELLAYGTAVRLAEGEA